jgi:hypothetical protein
MQSNSQSRWMNRSMILLVLVNPLGAVWPADLAWLERDVSVSYWRRYYTTSPFMRIDRLV